MVIVPEDYDAIGLGDALDARELREGKTPWSMGVFFRQKSMDCGRTKPFGSQNTPWERASSEAMVSHVQRKKPRRKQKEKITQMRQRFCLSAFLKS